MPKSVKTFAYGRKKRSYKKPRGRYATKSMENNLLDALAGEETLMSETPSSTSSTTASTSGIGSLSLPSINGSPTSDDDQDLEEVSEAPLTSVTDADIASLPLVTETPIDHPEPCGLNSSRFEEKLAAMDSHGTSCELSDDRNFFIHSTFFSSLLDIVVCPTCIGSDVTFQYSHSVGLACRFSLLCNTCNAIVWSSYSSPKCKDRYDINVRAVLASKECGVCLSTMKDLFSIMNIPNVMHHKTYRDISDIVKVAAKDAADEVMRTSADVIRERHKANVYATEQISDSGIQVVGVSYDGTWHKRGHSSHYGVGVAIDIDSGLVLDTHSVSNYCVGCLCAPSRDSADFTQWQTHHKPLCNKNFGGSSNAMEAEAARVIFSRSVKDCGLIYGTMLCDGDSKALNKVNDLEIYDITVRKEDCVNHIAKRIFNQLEQLKKDNKKKLNRKLTASKIKKITNTYATNLRKNAPDVEKMKLGVIGGFLHMMSTDRAPNHRLCPDGENSWCKYKNALARGRAPPPHQPTLTTEVGTLVYPIIRRLTDPDLLKRCAKMTTQNPNESFNSIIWKRCPKTNFAHLPNIETAVALSVISFNVGPCGLSKVFERLGLTWGVVNNVHALKVEKTRLRHSKRKGKSVSRWKRKHLRERHLEETDKIVEEEGVTYSSGAFNS